MPFRIVKDYKESNGEWKYRVEKRYLGFLWFVHGDGETWSARDMSLDEAEAFVDELFERDEIVKPLITKKRKLLNNERNKV